MLDIALGMLLGAYLIWWCFVKHDPNKIHFGFPNWFPNVDVDKKDKRNKTDNEMDKENR